MSTVKVAEKEKGMEIQLNLRVGRFWGKIHSRFLGVGDFKMAIPTEVSSWQIIKCVALRVTWAWCLHRLGAMECRILTVLVTDYCPWKRENKQVSRQSAQLLLELCRGFCLPQEHHREWLRLERSKCLLCLSLFVPQLEIFLKKTEIKLKTTCFTFKGLEYLGSETSS